MPQIYVKRYICYIHICVREARAVRLLSAAMACKEEELVEPEGHDGVVDASYEDEGNHEDGAEGQDAHGWWLASGGHDGVKEAGVYRVHYKLYIYIISALQEDIYIYAYKPYICL
ncbi:unnamed protein product [Symbiodinium natans]|uniref:Uncharacterized protein n=1 Tax=Symbiodinium natans TaxID=878477 RepID=A0A812SH26_9DINO|nr:unnamed protein product [Symbiodinium natans]